MSNHAAENSSQLPAYITGAVPNPAANRAPWYKNTAPTYAGIFLWFVFWQDAVLANSKGGGLAQGIGVALLGLVIAALICHFLFYLVPGMLGLKTGLPLYIVGTSTFGATGGFILPGFLMGLLQFGWLGVNAYFSSLLLAPTLGVRPEILMVIWGVLAAFVGLKGIQYVAKVATYLPLIPVAVLLIMFFKTIGGLGGFDATALADNHSAIAGYANPPMSTVDIFTGGVLGFLAVYVVGFFATAGAAGVDFGTNSRDKKDVSMGGWVGIALAIVLTAGLSTLIVAGVHGHKEYGPKAVQAAEQATEKAVAEVDTRIEALTAAGKAPSADAADKMRESAQVGAASQALLRTTSLLGLVVGEGAAKWMMFLLALAAFPPACFSSFIAANSFKTTLPNVNPFISVGIGAAVSIILAVTGVVGDAIGVFVIIGASFGPICGAMLVDYWLAGKRWSGPRAGFNPAGWIAWAIGFCVGIFDKLTGYTVPAAPVAAFVVGAVVYFICMKIGLASKVLPLPAANQPSNA
ncbi:MAG: cytosine permease [Verrucomicrobiales bacterium]|nr:cytosine permease [Verrucomicrobiales bacterium]